MTILDKAVREKRASLSEHESKQLLRHYGIPVTREKEVADREALLQALEEIGYPVVLKACAPALTHKTEHDLVRLDIRTAREALAAFAALSAAAPEARVLVQEMVGGKRELVMGMVRDPQFGPCVMFGLGGIFTEVLRDVSFRVAPLQTRDALEMMAEIQAHRILEALRGLPAADKDELAGMLVALGRIGCENPNIREIDVNPVILAQSRPVAVDALVLLDLHQPPGS